MPTTPDRAADAVAADLFPTVDYQKQRVQLVARVLCGLDDVEPGAPSWGSYLLEAARYIAAFDVLKLHADAVADARRNATTGH